MSDSPSRRTIRLADLRADVRARFGPAAASPAAFDDYVASLQQATLARERDGEYDHLVSYLLQSSRFTREPRVEPALSAHELLGESATAKRTGPPDVVRRRVRDFVRAIGAGSGDSRLAYFRRLLAETSPSRVPLADHLLSEYERTMRFLYEKEFVAQRIADVQQREAALASLYRGRGLSTDTEVEANFAVYEALSVIRSQAQRGLDRVLIVGPGLDFAPRTDLVDAYEPQSYQPFAVADALLGLGLSDPARLRIHCVDVNRRVLDYLGRLGAGPVGLQIFTGIPERHERPLEPAFREYFERLGRQIGREGQMSPPIAGRLGKSLLLRPEVARWITAGRLDVVAERYEPSPGYDLVVVTNVFGYFGPTEQALALCNVRSMLREGGYLVHNEPQTSLVSAAEAEGLALCDARTVRLAGGQRDALFDRILIHRKSRRPESGREGLDGETRGGI